MPSNSFRVTIRSNRTPQVVAALRLNAKEAVDVTAQEVRTRAYQLAPVDTGALRNSIYVNNGENSDYAERVGVAGNLNPEMDALVELSPEFVIPLSGSAATAYLSVIGAAAHYGIFLEYGTVFQPPQSFMRPAVEASADEFNIRMGHIADNV